MEGVTDRSGDYRERPVDDGFSGSERPGGIVLGSDPSPLDVEEKVSFWNLFKKHKMSVLVDCLVFGIFGMGVAFLGPTLFDLGCQTKSDLKQMNWVFFVQLLMTMIGSITAGFMAGRIVPAHILLCIGMTGLPITMFLIPACSVLWQLLINLVFMGWFMGCVDCVANLRMILRFGTNVTPFLQAMHFFYGLGAFISPMIASPFLLNIDCSPFIDGYTAIPAKESTNNESITVSPQPQVVNRATHLSHSKEAFFILGAIQTAIQPYRPRRARIMNPLLSLHNHKLSTGPLISLIQKKPSLYLEPFSHKIASPFLLNIHCSPFIAGYTAIPAKESTNNESITVSPQPQVVNRATHLSHSKEAFFILGAIQFVITLVVYLVIALERKWGILYSPTATPTGMHGSVSFTEDSERFREYSGSSTLARCFGCGTKEIVIITGLTSASLFIYDGVQSSYAGYIYSYAEKNVDDLDRREGAVLNSCFWGPFALGRLIAVLLSTKFSAAFMLACNISGSAFALLLTLLWQSSRTVIYVGTITLGIFLSSMSPTVMALTEQFLHVNAPITSCMVVFAALGETICPVIVGNLFVSAGPVSFLAFCFTIICVAIIIYAILLFLGRDTAKYRENTGSSFIFLSKPPQRFGENMEINSTSVKYYSNQSDDQPTDTTYQSTDSTANGYAGNYK